MTLGRVLFAAAVTAMSVPAHADLTGFVQLRHAQRAKADAACSPSMPCSSMVNEASGELLHEHRFGSRASTTLRVEGWRDAAIGKDRLKVREAFADLAPSDRLSLKLGRQVVTWGVSDYLYVNDIFPKNYDSFFTGGGMDRMKQPVDAAKLSWRLGGGDLEAVLSRSRGDTPPRSDRFLASGMAASALDKDDADDRADLAARWSGHSGGVDWAAYAARYSSRERRYLATSTGLQYERPLTSHLGVSLTGNAANGLAWAEVALRDAQEVTATSASRHFYASAVKVLGGYSRELLQDLTASVQVQLEAPLSHGDYRASLAPGMRPTRRTAAMVHLRVQGQWLQQTVRGGAQIFGGDEGDTHFNPFVSWSPADGWAIEGGANVFNGKPDTRFGMLRDDSNVYVLGRYSF